MTIYLKIFTYVNFYLNLMNSIFKFIEHDVIVQVFSSVGTPGVQFFPANIGCDKSAVRQL